MTSEKLLREAEEIRDRVLSCLLYTSDAADD